MAQKITPYKNAVPDCVDEIVSSSGSYRRTASRNKGKPDKGSNRVINWSRNMIRLSRFESLPRCRSAHIEAQTTKGERTPPLPLENKGLARNHTGSVSFWLEFSAVRVPSLAAYRSNPSSTARNELAGTCAFSSLLLSFSEVGNP